MELFDSATASDCFEILKVWSAVSWDDKLTGFDYFSRRIKKILHHELLAIFLKSKAISTGQITGKAPQKVWRNTCIFERENLCDFGTCRFSIN